MIMMSMLLILFFIACVGMFFGFKATSEESHCDGYLVGSVIAVIIMLMGFITAVNIADQMEEYEKYYISHPVKGAVIDTEVLIFNPDTKQFEIVLTNDLKNYDTKEYYFLPNIED